MKEKKYAGRGQGRVDAGVSVGRVQMLCGMGRGGFNSYAGLPRNRTAPFDTSKYDAV